VKRLILLAAVAAATISSSCNYGGTVVPPPPPVGNFFNSSLKGQYTFSMAGALLDNFGNGFRVARVGSFIADGSGNITSALEDVFSEANGTVTTVSFTSGKYSIQANGYGTMTLNVGTTSSLSLSVVLQNSTQGVLVQNDAVATSSGSFNLASATTPASFSTSEITGNYVFDVSGVSSVVNGNVVNDAAASIIGQFQANGSTVTGGTVDQNDGNQAAPSGPLTLTAGNSIQLDPTNGNGAKFGRGTLTLTTGNTNFNFVFYVVNSGRIKLMELDPSLNQLGDAVLQSAGIPTQGSGLQNSFAFLIGGSGTSSTTTGPLARAGRLTADGSGNLGTIFADQNFNGTAIAVTPTTAPSGTYTIDTNHPGTGRGTLTFTDSQQGTFDYIFYLNASTQGVIQDISLGVIGDGSLEAQVSGPFGAPSVATPYAFSWSGVDLGANNSLVFEDDFAGQYLLPLPSGQKYNGAIDIVQLGSSGKIFIPQDPVTVTLTLAGDGTSSNSFEFLTADSPTKDYKFRTYFVNQQTMFLVGIDNTVVIAGVVSQQL
jgi:hypothetical protein